MQRYLVVSRYFIHFPGGDAIRGRCTRKLIRPELWKGGLVLKDGDGKKHFDGFFRRETYTFSMVRNTKDDYPIVCVVYTYSTQKTVFLLESTRSEFQVVCVVIADLSVFDYTTVKQIWDRPTHFVTNSPCPDSPWFHKGNTITENLKMVARNGFLLSGDLRLFKRASFWGKSACL